MQVQLKSSLGALQQAVASSHAAINTLRQAGLAELASSHVLKQAEVPRAHFDSRICFNARQPDACPTQEAMAKLP